MNQCIFDKDAVDLGVSHQAALSLVTPWREWLVCLVFVLAARMRLLKLMRVCSLALGRISQAKKMRQTKTQARRVVD